MPGIIPPPTPPGKLGWDGQTALVVPKAGLSIVPGAGLVGRTALGKMFLDTATSAVAETVQCFAPGAVTTRTFDVWRNRRPLQDGTLSVLDVYAAGAPTPDASPAANYWRLVVTDSAGSSIVVPLSQDAKNAHGLDRAAGVGFVQPWGTYATAGLSGGTPSGVAFAHRLRPTQGMVIGGATVHGKVISLDGGTNPQLTSGLRVRAQLCDSKASVLATGYVWITGANDAGGNELWNFVFDRAQQLTAGSDYWLTFDCGLDTGTFTHAQIYCAQPSVTTIAGGVPARLFGAVGDATGCVSGQAESGVSWRAQLSAVGATSVPGMQGATLAAKAIAADASSVNGLVVQNTDMSSGWWQLNGTTSGVAPISGDLTFSLSAVGAPAAGSGGSDLNVRAVILP